MTMVPCCGKHVSDCECGKWVTEEQKLFKELDEMSQELDWKSILDLGKSLEIHNDNGDRIFRSYYMKCVKGYNTFYHLADGDPQRCGNGFYDGFLEAEQACQMCYREYLVQYLNAKKDMKARKKRDAVTISVIIKEMAFKDPENEIFHTIYELLTPEQKETVYNLGVD